MQFQSTKNIFLVKPKSFGFNSETSKSNAFQNQTNQSTENISYSALDEFNEMSKILIDNKINTIVFEDSISPIKPDAIFPNNWISMHHSGKIIIYPMLTKNRQQEINKNYIEYLSNSFFIDDILDLSNHHHSGTFLEGTGSMVFDHINRTAYACISERTNITLFEKVCKILDYQPISFLSIDKNSQPIYHTNVMMSIGTDFVTICLESIRDKTQKSKIIDNMINSGRTIIDISYEQMNNFAGNMLELKNSENEKIIVLSISAFSSLSKEQLNKLEENAKLLPIKIPTIETIGGGSVRCMIAEVFLPKKFSY